MTRRTSSLGRARRGLLVLLAGLLVALAAVAVLLLGDDPQTGCPVEVTVVDAEGAPLARARAQARYAPGWLPVDSRGRVRVPDVPVRAEEPTSAESLARALEVVAPGHAMRRGAGPIVEKAADGSWHARVVLEAYGRVRLRIDPGPVAGLIGWLEDPGPPGAVEAESGVEVARAGQPAAWRVFGAGSHLVVRHAGPNGVAAGVRRIEAPAAGFVREIAIEGAEASPIRGRIVLPESPASPSHAGRLEVSQVVEGGMSLPMPSVAIDEAGLFTVPYAGAERYHLRAVLGFHDGASVTARGGAEVVMDALAARPWVVLGAAPWADADTAPRVRVLRLPSEESVGLDYGRLLLDESLHVALPGPGRFRLVFLRPGTDAAPPVEGRAEIEVTQGGPHEIQVAAEERAWGRVRVAVDGVEASGGATVELLGEPVRRRTLLPRLQSDATFDHVAAAEGPVGIHVIWRAEDIADAWLAGTVAPDEELLLQAAPRQGGHVELEFEREVDHAGAREAPEALAGVEDGVPASLPLRWLPGDSPYGPAIGEVLFTRRPGTQRWRTKTRLRPGTYHVRWNEQFLSFEVRPGEVTVATLRIPR